MKQQMFSFLMPYYNEAIIIEKNMIILLNYLEDRFKGQYEIVPINDGSFDRSSTIVDKISLKYPQIKPMGYLQNMGRGNALRHACEKIVGDYIIYLDTDLPSTIDLFHIDIMMDNLQKYDIVIASRFVKEAKIKRMLHRAMISKTYRLLLKMVFMGFPVTDPDVGFKGFGRKAYFDICPKTTLNGWSWDLEFLFEAFRSGYSIYEFPFHWVETYEDTKVNYFDDSVAELVGMLYVKFKHLL